MKKNIYITTETIEKIIERLDKITTELKILEINNNTRIKNLEHEYIYQIHFNSNKCENDLINEIKELKKLNSFLENKVESYEQYGNNMIPPRLKFGLLIYCNKELLKYNNIHGYEKYCNELKNYIDIIEKF